MAKQLAESAYDPFRRIEDRSHVSDFERAVKDMAALPAKAPKSGLGE